MNRILSDARAFAIQYMRGREGAFFAFAFPVILILLFGAIFSGGGNNQVSLYVQDLDGTPASQAFVASLNNTSAISWHGVPRDVDMNQYIKDHSIANALLISQGFGANVTRARAGDPTAHATVTLFGDPTQSTYGIVLGVLNGSATGFNFQIANARPVISVATDSVTTRPLKFIDLFLPGVIGLSALTTPMFGMAFLCSTYRERKYFKLLATTSLTKGEWLASKVIFYVAIMLVSVAIMVATKVLLFGGPATVTPLAILIIAAGTLEFTSLGMIVGLFTRDSSTASTIANAVGFPMMFLAGSFFPLETMPPTLQTIARVLPLTYVNEGLKATMVYGNDALAFNYLIITAVLGIGLFLIPARALSWKTR